MTNKERKEKRYKKRKAERDKKKNEFVSQFDDFEWVFSYDHLYDSYKKSRRNVSWKTSVKSYITQAPLLINQTYNELHNGSFQSDGFYEFNINERGKVRHIRSVTIKERVVQRCLCDYALIPVLSRSFIYDNSASLQGKGYHFAMNRLCNHLRDHYRENGNSGYILTFDFSKYFDNISHEVCKKIIRDNFTDKRIIALVNHFIDCFGDVGLGLGSQISQIFALAVANRLDHYVKEVLRIHGYGRYMDDGYLIHKDKDYLKYCLSEIEEIYTDLGIVLNKKKTQIIKISRGFTWLKCQFFLTDSGKIIKKVARTSITRHRRKLKSLRKFLNEKKLTIEDINTSQQTWKSYAQNFNSYNTVKSIDRLYEELFKEELT